MAQLMGSREIAELCGKTHQQVCLDIEKLDTHYTELGLLKIERSNYILGNDGQEYQEYYLTKEQTLDLVTGYNLEERIKINRRWLDLEQDEADATYKEDLRLQYARKEALELLGELDNADKLLRKAEEARQNALAQLGDLYDFDQRMIAKYGDKYPIRRDPDAVKIWNKMVDKLNAGDKQSGLDHWMEWFDVYDHA